MRIFCVYTDIPEKKLSGEFIHWTLISDINYRDGKIIRHKSSLKELDYDPSENQNWNWEDCKWLDWGLLHLYDSSLETNKQATS